MKHAKPDPFLPYRKLVAPPLEREEERELLRRAKGGDKRAQDRIVASCIGFVFMVAKRQRIGSTMALDDVIQEGTIGLIKAIEKFDLDQPVRFGTYAIWWIRALIGKHMREGRSVVRPHGSSVAQQDGSLDAPADDEGELTRGATLVDEGAIGEREIVQAEHDLRVRQVLERLHANMKPIDWDVVEHRLLADGDPDTLDVIGKRHGVTRERVRQIEKRIVSVLQRTLPMALADRPVANRPMVVVSRKRPAPPVHPYSDEALVARLRAVGHEVDPPDPEWLPPERQATVSSEALLANSDFLLLRALSACGAAGRSRPARPETIPWAGKYGAFEKVAQQQRNRRPRGSPCPACKTTATRHRKGCPRSWSGSKAKAVGT